MVAEVSPRGDANLDLPSEVESYFQQHSGVAPAVEPEEEPPEQEETPAEPAEAEADATEAPSAAAPSQTEEPEEVAPEEKSASDVDWKRWFGLAAKTLETDRPQWSQIPAGVRESVAASLDAELGGTVARDALRNWTQRLVATPEEIVEREQAAKAQGQQEAALQAQWDAYNAQVWQRFAAVDPDINGELGGDDYDLFEAQRSDQQGYAYYQQLKQQYAIQNDPQAQVEQIATQRAAGAQRELLNGLLGEFIRSDFIASVPAIKGRIEQAQASDGFLESQGYSQDMQGFTQFFISALREASEFHSNTRSAKKVMEKTADIQAAAERAARGKALQSGLVRDTAGTGSAAPSYMPPGDALAGGTPLIKWMAANPDKKAQWVANGRPGYRGQGWAGQRNQR